MSSISESRLLIPRRQGRDGHPRLAKARAAVAPERAAPRIVFPDGSVRPMSQVIPGWGGGSSFTGALASPNRGFIVFPTLDTRREINQWSRLEMLRRARWLYNNVGFAKRIVRSISRMMGSLVPDPNSLDTAWKSQAIKVFNRLTKSPLLFERSAKFTFAGYQKYLSRRYLIDGDVLTVFSRGETGQAQIAPFEAHQLADPAYEARTWEDESRWYDGVEIDRGNRATRFRIVDMDDPSKFTDFPAAVAHLTTVWERAGQPRGVTPFHPVINRMLDIQEITSDMMLGIKSSNLVGFYLAQKRDGATPLGADGLAGGLRDHLAAAAGADPINPETVEGRKFEDVFKGGAIPEFDGYEPGVIHDDRPAQNQMDLLRWFIRENCLSFDYPPEALWEFGSLNGNTARLMKEDVQEVLDSDRADILVPFCQRAWFHVIGTEIAEGRLPEPSVGEWWDVSWIAPKKKTIDRGAEGRLNLEERRQPGMRTLARHFGELQLTWESEVDQWLEEQDYILERAREKNWSPARIAALEAMLLAAPQGAATPGTTPDPDEKPDPDDDDK